MKKTTLNLILLSVTMSLTSCDLRNLIDQEYYTCSQTREINLGYINDLYSKKTATVGEAATVEQLIFIHNSGCSQYKELKITREDIEKIKSEWQKKLFN